MRLYKPSRILNEEQNFAGINTSDLMVISLICLAFVYPALFFDKVFYTVPIIFFIFTITAVIRQNHRRRFIRDTINFFSNERLIDATDYRRKNSNR